MYHYIHNGLARVAVILALLALSLYAIYLAVDDTGVLRVRRCHVAAPTTER